MTKVWLGCGRVWFLVIAVSVATASNAAPNKNKTDDEADFQFAVKAARLVKASAKDPSSFEVVKAGLVPSPGGTVCIMYRAKNSFNATVTELVAVRRNMSRGDWNKECARPGLTDMSHIRKAL